MGPFDNETGEYVFDQEVMDAHWLINEAKGNLYIIARSGDGFDGYGADDDIESRLFKLPDAKLEDQGVMLSEGFSLVPDVLRRFSPDVGFYSA
jgi:hypothetical protein